jgi:lysophospholipase L1-like esterase
MQTGIRSSRRRSFFWTLLLVPFLLLPYRWLAIPCGLAAVLLIQPGSQSLRQILARDGTLIAGSVLILLVRTVLDLTWWLPWVAVFAGLVALRWSRIWRGWMGYPLAPLAFTAAILLLLRPTEWPLRQQGEIIGRNDLILVCAGDSLTSGVKPGTDAGTYVASLRERFGCRVINAGVANDRAADLLSRLDRSVLSHEPDIVLLFIGGNDYLDGTPRAQFNATLDNTAARIAAAGAKLVIVEVPTGIIWNPFAGIYCHTSRRYGAILVPETRLRMWYSVELLFRDWLKDPLTIDGIHLSPSGALKVADWLAPHLINAADSRDERRP